MKRHGKLWEKVCDLDNIRAAHHAARKGKAHYAEVKWVNANEDEALKNIQKLLLSKTFTTSFYEVEDRFDGRKMRTIHKLPYYPDRIVQHALVTVCEPIWKGSFIRDTFQSIVGRGTNDARKRVEAVVRGNTGLYALKFDIQKYYPSVNNKILKCEVRRKIKCPDTLWLIDNIIDSNQGLPIGNYTSQYFGNVYLSAFDWWVKQEIRPVGYFRYCDDLVLLARTPAEAHGYRMQVFERLHEAYGLTVKQNWQVFPVDDRGLDFVGFVFRSSGTRLRKGIAVGVRDKARAIRYNHRAMTPYEIANGAGSYWGWCKHADAKALWHRHMRADVKRHIAASKVKIQEMQRCV
jgi:RNA-directed DNA polymerase